ncbi:hypothetical protein C8F01DRAFT_747472 [Mycena amicta]|nr:hypothetical protein C8F01DRAFT_747472 [Mycena amicta]
MASQCSAVLERRRGPKPNTNESYAAAILELQNSVAVLRQQLSSHHQTLVSVQERSVALQEESIAENTASLDAADVVEKHECVARCLQAYNDVLFDLARPSREPGERRMVPQEKEVLKREGLGYITKLLEPRKVLRPHIEDLRKRVLRMLTPRECQLCEALYGILKEHRGTRNLEQHPMPHRTTVLNRLQGLGKDDLRTLENFLLSDPQRLPTNEDLPYAGLHLFAADGKYESVEVKMEKLQAKKRDKDLDKQKLAQFEGRSL